MLHANNMLDLSIWVAFFTGRDGYDDSGEGSGYVDIWEVVT